MRIVGMDMSAGVPLIPDTTLIYGIFLNFETIQMVSRPYQERIRIMSTQDRGLVEPISYASTASETYDAYQPRDRAH